MSFREPQYHCWGCFKVLLQLGDSGFTVLYTFIWLDMQSVWSYCTFGSSGHLEALLCCWTHQRKKRFLKCLEVSRMVGALGHARTFFPSLTSIWCPVMWELWAWRHSAGACLSTNASLDKSRQVSISATCLLVGRWHDGTHHDAYSRLACWKG